ncbi:hypothetical protein PUNSTDRAFT_50722 [Punctularia strigosozonata HHB-11173 SS5]|uniref:uncharacterized protein n=1 Tax=Punctularia strigosozonata (strain HHB-11173) TaxID=741275 RepID=UPI0004417E46|nr:uncharacterized protein PUNSTDRAFT_50722 [Punctularia strigosozonata HHB-11173 SS5]EIN11889.1 hypothetical protein PUNSTDRAFT_50722 [Punctularia strigosozonata HHB-11173 SS5]
MATLTKTFKKVPSGGGLPKRKRTASFDAGSESPDSSAREVQRKPSRDGPKKKKANRACFHCQKSHLTCDDSRPCQRCIKRGIADNCTEGHRKKAKYLLDDEELAELKNKNNSHSAKTVTPTPVPPPPTTTQAPTYDTAPLPTSEPFLPNDPLFNVSFDPNFPFGSEAANLEYSILSAILGGPSPPEVDLEQALRDELALTELHANNDAEGLDTRGHEGSPEPYMQTLMEPSWPVSSPLASTLPLAALGDFPSAYRNRTYGSSQLSVAPGQTTGDADGLADDFITLQYSPQQEREQHQSLLSTSPRLGSARLFSDSVDSGEFGADKAVKSSVYEKVTAPYDYTEGYHALMKHLSSRFEKNDILRIVRALAIFRPSLIALQLPLSEEDEVFVEKCFQRSLLELNKLISFSGTPTVAWRRTGEICLVGAEFSTLTEWSRESLLGQRKYIWELFENQSVVEYWENFASHAFENTTQSVYAHCILLKPSGTPVPCTFCFSIRRDMFDLPSLVIGQWLPLL